MSTALPYLFPIGIDPADIDFMGHVNNASYLKWVQDAVIGHWRSLAPAEAVAETFKMPSVVGMNLQDAQDLLQSLGSYVMDQEDASGRGRLQLLDRNWKVCTQDPGAGKSVDISAVVTLGSVKLGESCP